MERCNTFQVLTIDIHIFFASETVVSIYQEDETQEDEDM